MYNEHYTKTINRHFILFLLRKGEEYELVNQYIKENWKEGIDSFLNKQIPVTKRPQRLFNIAFNFYSTKEGYDYWNKIANEWKEHVKKSIEIQEAIKIRRK
jgi:hypothetical protein